MVGLSELLNSINAETKRVLDEMERTKDFFERKIQSEIVLNLCQSLGVFFNMATNMMDEDISDFLDDDEES